MEYELKVTQQEAQIIIAALGELPLKATINLFMKLNSQVQSIDAARAVPIEQAAAVVGEGEGSIKAAPIAE